MMKDTPRGGVVKDYGDKCLVMIGKLNFVANQVWMRVS